ncbi:MAG: glycosyl hydrolase [Oscillospiraceae bacterium]
MKKKISILLAVLITLTFSLTACRNEAEPSSSASDTDTAVSEITETDTDEVDLSYQTDIAALRKSLSEAEVDASKPVSKNASKETTELFNYLKSIEGKHILSGQQMFYSEEYEDLTYYLYANGKLPALHAYDFLNTTTYKDNSQVDAAIRWHTECNGIVMFCWHWMLPKDRNDETQGYSYEEWEIDFDKTKCTTPGTDEYKRVIRDIDLVAEQLKILEEKGVPVIWRPLHEAAGDWFWWGMTDTENSKEIYRDLWYIIFDRLENYHKLTNLIWVWNGQDEELQVSKNTFDIVSDDIYPRSERNHSSNVDTYKKWKELAGDKMVTLSECEFIPDPELLQADGAAWLSWTTWWGEYIYDANDEGRPKLKNNRTTPVLNDKYIDQEFLTRVMASDYVITLDELPEWDDDTLRDLPYRVRVYLTDFPEARIPDGNTSSAAQ